MGAGVLLSYTLTANNDISLVLVVFSLLIIATLTSMIFANFLYKSISNLEALASKIAKGRTKKRYIKALKEDSGEFGKVASSISEISENLKDKINQIAKQRDQFGSVLDDLGEGIVVTDIEGNITFENDQFSQILNLKNVHGQNIKDLVLNPLDIFTEDQKKEKELILNLKLSSMINLIGGCLPLLIKAKLQKNIF